MAWTPPSAGDLRQMIRFDRQENVSDGMGGFDQTWTPLTTVAAKVGPMRGGEQIRAERLSGIEPVEIIVRSDAKTRSIVQADRAVDTRTGRTFNIKWSGNLDERDRFIVILAEAGGHLDG